MRKKITLLCTAITAIPLVLIAVLSLVARPAPDSPFYSRPGFRIIAHRGGLGLGPENTIETFARSLAAGADTLEMDIRMTRDGELVVLHDATVDRTTDGSGAVRDMDLADMKKLDAGYRWSQEDNFSFRGRNITIPTLAEVLETFPDIPLVIEVKEESPQVAESLCRLLAQYHKTDSVLIASMHGAVLSRFRESCPEAATSAGPRAVLVFYLLNKAGLDFLFTPDMAALQVPVAFRDRRIVTPDFITAAHGRNLKVEVWTVNDMDKMQRLINAGVDGIVTDYPDRLKTVVDNP